MFGLSLSSLLPYIIGAVVILGAVAYIYNMGATNERNATATEAVKVIKEDTHNRIIIEDKNRNLDDDAATKCLRNPNGC